MNYFEILKLPIAYNSDADLLTRNYFSVQRDSENQIDSSLLNEAYNVLKNDIKRAEYFLNLKNISTEKMSSELAVEMFEIREKYSLLENDDDKIAFQNQIKKKKKELISLLKKSENDLEKFSEIFSELKFLNSFLEKERADVYSRN
jgi:DnaJ-domain-containing protein 1